MLSSGHQPGWHSPVPWHRRSPGTTPPTHHPWVARAEQGEMKGAGPAIHPTAAVPHGACVPPRRSVPICHIRASWLLALASREQQLADG